MKNIAFTHPFATTHYYSIGGHMVGVTGIERQRLSELLPTFEPFAVDPSQPNVAMDIAKKTLFVLHITTRQDFLAEAAAMHADAPSKLTDFEWEGGQCTVRRRTDESIILHLIAPGGIQEGDMVVTGNSAIAHLPEEREAAAFVLNNFLMMLYAFTAAACYTLLMHASVVIQQGHGYLFLGRSGTGKSTHSSLWLRHVRGSELLNDDNPILRIDPITERVTVYGSPWSGKTPCYRPVQVPVAAIVRLSQAPVNRMEQQETAHAFATLLPSCSCLKQENDIYNGVLQTVCRIVQHTPIYRLDCLPDRAAACLCYRTAAMQANVYNPADIDHE